MWRGKKKRCRRHSGVNAAYSGVIYRVSWKSTEKNRNNEQKKVQNSEKCNYIFQFDARPFRIHSFRIRAPTTTPTPQPALPGHAFDLRRAVASISIAF